jgi:hypothetical protein
VRCVFEPFVVMAGMRTNAIKKGDKYILNGSKHLLLTVFMLIIILLLQKTDLE